MCTRCSRYVAILLALLLTTACGGYRPVTSTLNKSSALQRVAVQGGELEYRLNGSGEPVLLIHGSVFADVFDGLLADQALANYQLITYHRRGFAGSTRAPAPFTIEQQAADAIALLDKLGIRRAHVAGHSYGGSVALQMAAAHPDRVASLLLLEATVPTLGSVDPGTMEGLTAAAGLHKQGDARAATIRFVNAVAPGAWEEMSAAGATALQDQAVADIGTFFDIELPALMQWKFTTDDLAKLRTPALVVVGAQSSAGYHEGHAALKRALPQSEELVVAGADHALQMKQPQAVAVGFYAFLRKHPIRQ